MKKIVILLSSNQVFIKDKFLKKEFQKIFKFGRICQLIFNFKVFTVRTIKTGSTRNFAGVDHKLSQNLRVRAKTYSFCGIRRFQ